MTRWLREFRLVPVVLIATGCLFALKTMGLIFDGGYTLGQRLGSDTLVVTRVPVPPSIQLHSTTTPLEIASAQGSKRSWMQEMFNYPGGGGSGGGDITGSITTTKPAEKEAMEKAEAAKSKPGKVAEPSAAEIKAASGKQISLEPQQTTSPAERALLERLQARRQELDARARELDLRETMLKAAEKKLDGGAGNGGDAKPGAAAVAERREDSDAARFKALVTMYEAMKPKDAAKIFDRLDLKVLIEVASQIKPQQMAAIMALMSPEGAERLTMEMAARAGGDRSSNPANLPKIEGRSGG
jgi:flagellar motility protein MotE (MotC chaperone)